MNDSLTAPSVVPVEQRLVAAARDLFFRKGYYATTTLEIASQAGTSETGLARKFPSKPSKYGLLMAVYNASWKAANDAIGEPVHDDPCEEIIRIVTVMADLYHKDKLAVSFMLINTGNTDTLLIERNAQAIISDENCKYIDRIRGLCEAAVQRNLVNPKFTPVALTEAILGMSEGLLLGWYLADNSPNYGAKTTLEDTLVVFSHLLSRDMNSSRSAVSIPDPTSYLPASVHEMVEIVGRICDDNGPVVIQQIAELRDYAEQERYLVKEEVDSYLVESPTANLTRAKIEEFFRDNDSIAAADKYLEMQQRCLSELHKVHQNAALNCSQFDLVDWRRFWEGVVNIADEDNAHAMYLSSDNWPFSVFHSVLAAIESTAGNNVKAFNEVLTGGQQDVRTYVYREFGGSMIGASRSAYTQHVIESKDLVRANGVIPLFAFEAAIKPSSGTIGSGYDLRRRFQKGVAEIVSTLAESTQQQEFCQLVQTYANLYAARTAYDIYEYFGFYAFIRHYLIVRCSAQLQAKDVMKAQVFQRLAATYQFHKALELIQTT